MKIEAWFETDWRWKRDFWRRSIGLGELHPVYHFQVGRLVVQFVKG